MHHQVQVVLFKLSLRMVQVNLNLVFKCKRKNYLLVSILNLVITYHDRMQRAIEFVEELYNKTTKAEAFAFAPLNLYSDDDQINYHSHVDHNLRKLNLEKILAR